MTSSVKIIAGSLKGRNISFHDNQNTRPTLGRVKETLFNWLTPFIDGANCLDLFAGSGSLGFEAISRGAQACQFIDQSKVNIEQINLNIKSFKLSNCATEISESHKYVTHTDQRYDIIFFDPPYKSNCYDWLDQVIEKLLKPDGIIYIESATKIESESLYMIREKKTKTLFYGIYKYDR